MSWIIGCGDLAYPDHRHPGPFMLLPKVFCWPNDDISRVDALLAIGNRTADIADGRRTRLRTSGGGGVEFPILQC